MSPRDEHLTGREAATRLLAEAEREEFLTLDLVARVLRWENRRVLRDWKDRRKYPYTRVGRNVMLSSILVLRAYFPHIPLTSPATASHSRHPHA